MSALSDELQQRVGDLVARRRNLLSGERERPQRVGDDGGAQILSDLLSRGAAVAVKASSSDASDASGGWVRRAMAAVALSMVASSGVAIADTHDRSVRERASSAHLTAADLSARGHEAAGFGPSASIQSPALDATELAARAYAGSGRSSGSFAPSRAAAVKVAPAQKIHSAARLPQEGVSQGLRSAPRLKDAAPTSRPGIDSAEWKTRSAAIEALPKVGGDVKGNSESLLAKVVDLSPVTVSIGGKTYDALNPLERIRLCKEVAADMKLNAHGLDWRNIYATVHAETGWAERTGMGLNGKPSFGLAQMEEATAKSLGIDPADPRASLVGVAMLLKEASAWAKARGHENKSAALSIYYNLSSKARNSWDGVSLHDLPQPTQNHIKNMSDGMRLATQLAPKYEKLLQEARRVERQEALAADAARQADRERVLAQSDAVERSAAAAKENAGRPGVARESQKAGAVSGFGLDDLARSVSSRFQRVFKVEPRVDASQKRVENSRHFGPGASSLVANGLDFSARPVLARPIDTADRRAAISNLVAQRSSMADMLDRLSGSVRHEFQQVALREQAQLVRQVGATREDYRMSAG